MQQQEGTILIVEDIASVAQLMASILEAEGFHVLPIVQSIEEAKNVLKEHLVDAVLLDLSLESENDGFILAQFISSLPKVPEIICVTGNPSKQSLLQTIRFKPFAVLTKPVQALELITNVSLCLNKAFNQHQEKEVFIKDSTTTVKLKYSEILYLEASNNYYIIQTHDRKYMIRGALSTFLEELDENVFVRVHRSFAVNINHVKRIRSKAVVLYSEDEIPVGPSYLKRIKALITT